jgi:hypothetical protein
MTPCSHEELNNESRRQRTARDECEEPIAPGIGERGSNAGELNLATMSVSSQHEMWTSRQMRKPNRIMG